MFRVRRSCHSSRSLSLSLWRERSDCMRGNFGVLWLDTALKRSGATLCVLCASSAAGERRGVLAERTEYTEGMGRAGSLFGVRWVHTALNGAERLHVEGVSLKAASSRRTPKGLCGAIYWRAWRLGLLLGKTPSQNARKTSFEDQRITSKLLPEIVSLI